MHALIADFKQFIIADTDTRVMWIQLESRGERRWVRDRDVVHHGAQHAWTQWESDDDYIGVVRQFSLNR